MPIMPVSAAVEAEVAKLYPHATNEELALAFHINVRQVQHIGTRHRLRKSHETLSRARKARPASPPSTLTKAVADASAASGATGLSKAAAVQQLAPARPDQIERTLHKLTADGKLHRAGRKGAARWFVKPAHAAAFHQATGTTLRPSAPAQLPAAAPSVVIAPAAGPAQQRGAPIHTAATRFTRCPGVPGPEARWHGGAKPIFSGRIGQYDDDAPRSWVAAITNRRAASGNTQEDHQ